MQIEKSRRIRRGVTLVELLVTISILVLLMGAAATAMRMSLDSRRIREAARAVSVYCSSAMTRAMETGRPAGVVIRPFEQLPQCAMVLEQAEVPPPYAGDSMDSVAKLRITGAPGSAVATVEADLFSLADPSYSAFTPSLVRNGDLIQFGHQGPWYKIEGPDNSDPPEVIDGEPLVVSIDLSRGQLLPWPAEPGWSAPVPYKIIRQPAISAAEPQQLPAGAVIDLEASGMSDVYPCEFSASHLGGLPVIIMFSPSGAVDQVYYRHPQAGYGPWPASEPIFLLVGKRQKIPPEPGNENWRDLENLWVTLSPQTGLVTTAEVAAADTLAGSREFARQAQSMGGR